MTSNASILSDHACQSVRLAEHPSYSPQPQASAAPNLPRGAAFVVAIPFALGFWAGLIWWIVA